MSIGAAVTSFEHDGRKVNMIDTPGESSFIADTLAALRVVDAAVFVINGVMGVEVHTERLWTRADQEGLARLLFVNMLDRERADFFRSLESLKAAFGPHVVATEIPIGSEHEIRGVIDLIDMTAFEYEGEGRGNSKQVEIPEELRRAGRGVPREADGRGRRELRRAHGALPRGRGDLPRRGRRRAQEGGHRGPPLPGHLRRRDAQPRHQQAARGAGRGSAVAGDARPGHGARRRGAARDRAGRVGRADRLRLQDHRRPLHRPDQHAPRLLGRVEERLPRPERRSSARRRGSASSPPPRARR